MITWSDIGIKKGNDGPSQTTIWAAEIASFKLRVHRSDLGTGWFASIIGVCWDVPLTSDKVDEAKCQAVAMLQVKCEAAILEIVKGDSIDR